MKGPEKAGEEAVAKPLPVRERRNKQYYEPEEIELQIAFDLAIFFSTVSASPYFLKKR